MSDNSRNVQPSAFSDPKKLISLQACRVLHREPQLLQKVKDDFQYVLRSLRTIMFINIINGSLNGMQIDVIR